MKVHAESLALGAFLGIAIMLLVFAVVPPYAIRPFTITCETGAYVDEHGVQRVDFAKRTC